VGSQFGLNSEYYRPLGPRSSWFVAPRAGVSSAQYPVYNDNTLVALYRNRMAVGGLDFGYGFGRSGELRLGYEGGYQSLSPQIGPQLLSTFSGATGNVRLQYIFNTLDDQTVPRNGEHITFDFKFFNANPGAPEAFPATELQIQNFFRIGDPSTVFFNAYGGTSFGYNAGVPLFPLGGVTRFAAYGTNSLLTDQYFLGQLGYIRQLKTLPPLLGSTIDLLGMVEVGKTYQLPFGPPPPRLPGDVVGAIIVNTLIGPVQVGGAVGNYGHAKAFFQVGRIF